MKKTFGLIAITCAINTCGVASQQEPAERQPYSTIQQYSVMSMTFAPTKEPYNPEEDEILLKIIALLEQEKPDVYMIRGSTHRVKAFMDKAYPLGYREGDGQDWSNGGETGLAWVRYNRALVNEKNWDITFSAIFNRKDHTTRHFRERP